MRTSRKYLDDAYLKIFPTERQVRNEIKQEPQEESRMQPIDESLPPYQKHLLRVQKYYKKNKAEILKKQSIYKANRPAEDKTRVRLLHYLNNDSSYAERMRDKTKDKYKFEFKNGKWI